MRREPRRDDYTICTAIAPDAVFTARTDATAAPYEPRFTAHISTHHRAKPQISDPQSDNTKNVAQVRFLAKRRETSVDQLRIMPTLPTQTSCPARDLPPTSA
jgi:hypothetical protein